MRSSADTSFIKDLSQIERIRELLPRAAWPLIARVLERVPASLLDRLFDYPGRLGIEGKRKLARLITQAQNEDTIALYRTSISLFDPVDIREVATERRLLREAERPLGNGTPWVAQGSPLDQLIQFQFRDWLPDLILGKFDKMTMAHSIEGRVPFMDDAVITAAACIPSDLKLAAGTNKKPLRDFARSLLPAEIAGAAKAAFYIPVELYMHSAKVLDLIHWALDPARIAKRGLFNPDWANSVLQSSKDGGFLPLKRLFAILSLELWFEKFCPDASWS